MRAIVTVGVSASGKSTWASELIAQEAAKNIIWQRIERDCIRKGILIEKGIAADLEWDKWKLKWEKEVNERADIMLEVAAQSRTNVIFSDTNLNEARLKSLVQKLQGFGYTVDVRQFPISFEEAVKRDTKRKNGVGVSALATQFEQWDKQFVTQYEGTKGAPKAIIVDIDGTLAHMNRGRGPFEWDKVEQDKLDEEVAAIVKALEYTGEWKIVVLSGRDGICRPQTERWLARHGIQYSDFFMRAEGDLRKDSIIKSEIFWRDIAPKYDVKMVIDDRPQVTRMWRSLGLKVIQVGNPYIEF